MGTREILFRAIMVCATASLTAFFGIACDTAVNPQPTSYTLTASANPPAGGRVERSPGQRTYDVDAVVTVTALANAGYKFVKWSGMPTPAPEGNSVEVTMHSDVALMANFQKAFTDSRDGHVYRMVEIGGKTWMAENLNFADAVSGTDSSWCYGDNEELCASRGRLYNWSAATRACPDGWRLPDRDDWGRLMAAAGGGVGEVEEVIGRDGNGNAYIVDSVSYYRYVGTSLKSESGWKIEGYDAVGTNNFGFSATPGGYRGTDGRFTQAANGYWWSAAGITGGYAYYWYMYHYNENVFEAKHDRGYGLSVRCVRN